KRINDDYGHRAGDFVLQHAVTLLAREVRAEDVVARYGGEEFGVICRDTTAIQAEVLAERLRALVAATPFVHDGQTLPVTVSIGIAEGSSHESAGALVEAADRALYLAKEAGRNCVRVVTP
ncbi:MAG: GGDEF domain-containing protein, partial [Myxococcales bacterium]|nr:GGDEF domain-containing protein [Myxococcales bacterium]